MVRCDSETRQVNARDSGEGGRRVGHPLYRRADIDHDRYNCDRLIRQAKHAESPHFNEASERRRRPRQQPAVSGFQVDAVVSHQTGEAQLGRLDDFQRKARLART